MCPRACAPGVLDPFRERHVRAGFVLADLAVFAAHTDMGGGCFGVECDRGHPVHCQSPAEGADGANVAESLGGGGGVNEWVSE